MSNAHQTAMKRYQELKSKPSQDRMDIQEYVRSTRNYHPDLVEMVDKIKQKFKKDFYIEVCLRRNMFMTPPDDIETYLKYRHTCPTPFYDRGAYRYDYKSDRIQYLWFVPSMEECDYYRTNLLNVRTDEKEAVQHVLDFYDGTLLKLAKTLNGEINDYELIFYRKDENGNPLPH